MDDSIRVNVGGDILWLSVEEFSNPKKRFWFEQTASSGQDPRWDARVNIAWAMYNALAYPYKPYKFIPRRVRGKFRFWLRCSLIKLGVI